MGDKSADKYLPGDTFPSQLTGWLLAANESLTCFSSLSLILGMGGGRDESIYDGEF